jgi:hypothetical protein
MALEASKMTPSPTLPPPELRPQRPRRRPSSADTPSCDLKFGSSATLLDNLNGN